jgi:membrane protease YdiL (CAAX protease family)
MSEYDHLLAAALAVLSVMLAFGKAPKQKDESTRWAFYRQGWFSGGGIAGVCLLAWSASGRSLEHYGMEGWLGDQPAQTALFAVLWAVTLTIAVGLISSGRGRARLLRIYAAFDWLVPRTRKELAGSWGTAMSAGIGEEVAYRGFLLWYLSAVLGLPAAVALTSLAFGFSHGYQRLSGCIWATIAGLLLACIYLLSESLLLVIWMHGTYNVASFTTGCIVLAGSPQRDRSSE